MSRLTFEELRAANVERCNSRLFYGTTLDERSTTDLGCALAGEVGEACNLIYKRAMGKSIPIADIAKELADAMTYLDLLAARLGIDLGEAVVQKFNEVSVRIDSPVRLAGTIPPTGGHP